MRTTMWTMMMAAVLVPGLMPEAAAAQERFTLNGNPAVYTLAGQVEVVRRSGSATTVTVERFGPDAARLEVVTGVVRGRETLRVIFPGDQVVYDTGQRGRYQTRLRVREDGTFGGDEGRQVRVTGAGDGLRAHVRVRVEVPEGRDLAAFVGAGTINARDLVADLELDTGAGSIEVSGIEGYVFADTGSGTIRISDVTGEVEADTGSGSIELLDIRGPRVSADTGSGNIRGDRITASTVLADTGSGSVELLALSADEVEVDTGSGSVEIELREPVDRMVVDTGSGGVTVHFATRVDAEIEIDTGAGSIEVDFPVEVTEMERDYFRGRAGSGAGSITIDTGSGSVRLTGGA